MTAQGGGSLPHRTDFAHLQFKEIPKAAVTTRQSTGLTLGEDALDAPLHGGSAMSTGSLVLDGASSWMAKSLDRAALPGCLRLREVHSLAFVRKQDICSTAEDVQCLAPGIKPNDIIVGAHIGAGLFGAVREALFQGRPAALKQIVLHLYADNILVYHHEVRMYLKLRGLWGYSVAELFSYGMDSHRSASIITERSTLSEEWPESDEELAVKSLREIHRLGVLHGDPHVKNVVFVGEGRRRRALWIDFEYSKFSSEKYKHDEEGLRQAAESIRTMAEQERYNAKEWLHTLIHQGVLSVDLLGNLTSMGTLSAFFLVSVSTLVLRVTQPDLPRKFQIPGGFWVCGVLVPFLSAFFSAGLFSQATVVSIARMLIWMVICLVIHFGCGFWHFKGTRE
ncbi:hypothetical protein HK105_209263 [Polyrhizophydium stewartii]|uniref:Protein kinase domain-containing protein n=1 Tax=Polyrhizophydium stewartii TaxID=2732419 RepID=A0ABR4MVI7_9FUNG